MKGSGGENGVYGEIKVTSCQKRVHCLPKLDPSGLSPLAVGIANGKKDPAQIKLLRRVPVAWLASSELIC